MTGLASKGDGARTGGRALPHLCVYLFVALLAVACSRGFLIEARGTRDHLTFHLATSTDAASAADFEITEFEVQRKAGADSWSTVWALRGEETLSILQYGGSYRGLKTSTRAEPLKSGVQYRALASANTSGAKGYAALQFYFDGAGKLIPSTLPSP